MEKLSHAHLSICQFIHCTFFLSTHLNPGRCYMRPGPLGSAGGQSSSKCLLSWRRLALSGQLGCTSFPYVTVKVSCLALATRLKAPMEGQRLKIGEEDETQRECQCQLQLDTLTVSGQVKLSMHTNKQKGSVEEGEKRNFFIYYLVLRLTLFVSVSHTHTHTHTSQGKLADGTLVKRRTAWSRCC